MTVMNILSTLSLSDKESIRKTGKTVRYKYSQSNIDFIIKFASVLVQNIFSSSKRISIDWDTSSFSLLEEVPKKYQTTRPDIIIICHEGIEVGCGEVKPPQKTKELINIDRVRVAEICKRQLHLRLQTSTSVAQLCTFGIRVGGMMLELTKLEFHNGKYDYSILKTMDLLGREKVYESIEKVLENLFSFKHLIEKSLPSEEQSSSSSVLFDQYSDLLKPTIRFLKLQ